MGSTVPEVSYFDHHGRQGGDQHEHHGYTCVPVGTALLHQIEGDGQKGEGAQDLVGCPEKLPQSQAGSLSIHFVEGKKPDHGHG